MFSLLLVGAVQLITQKGAMQCSWEVMHAPTQTQMWFEMEVGKWSGDHQFGCSLLFTMVILLQRFWETHPRSGSSAQFFQSKGGPLMLRLYMAESSGLHLVLVVIESCVRQAVFWSWVFAPWTNDFTFIRCLHLSKCVRPSLRLTRTAANILGQCQV